MWGVRDHDADEDVCGDRSHCVIEMSVFSSENRIVLIAKLL